jgi:hypothetical protein
LCLSAHKIDILPSPGLIVFVSQESGLDSLDSGGDILLGKGEGGKEKRRKNGERHNSFHV